MTDKIADDERKLAAALLADANARDAAATPPAAPAPAPVPDPAPIAHPLLGLVLVGHEGDAVPLLVADCDGQYGADTHFATVHITVRQAQAGLVISNDSMGGDPDYGFVKSLYLPSMAIASGSTTNPVTPAPAPPPIVPSPPLPPIVPVPAGSLPAWLNKAPLMTVTPVGVAARDVAAVAANVTSQSFNAWCGAAWNRAKSDFTKGPDGGHVSPPGFNALIGLCALDDVPMPRLIIASVAEAFRDPNSDGSYASPDGIGKIPGPTHTYTTEWWDAFLQKHMRGSSCAAYAASGGSNYIASANVAAGTWDKRGTVPDSPWGMGYDSCVAVDESTGDAFFQAANGPYRAIRKADGTFHDFTGSGTKGGYWDNGYGPHAVDLKRRRILNLVNPADSGHSGIGYRKFDDPTDFFPVKVIGIPTGTGVPVPWGGSGFGTDNLEAYDEVYICAHDCSSYWKLTFPDDETFKFEQLSVVGVTPSPGPGIYSRFRVCAHTLSLLVWPTFEDPLQVIRLRDVAASGTTPTPVTPTPVPSPTPDPIQPTPSGSAVTRAALEQATGLYFGFNYTAAQVAGMPIPDPAGPGDLIEGEGATGARAELGLVTGDCAMMVMSNLDPHAVASCLGTAKCQKNWPRHTTDKKTGDAPAKPWLNTTQDFHDDANSAPNLTIDSNPALSPDAAHQPHAIFVPAMHCLLTNTPGSLADFQTLLGELKHIVAWNYFILPRQARGPVGRYAGTPTPGDEWIDGIACVYPSAYLERGAAWVLASAVQLYLLLQRAKELNVATPDDGWYGWLRNTMIPSNIAFYNRTFNRGTFDNNWMDPYYVRGTGSYKNAIGLLVGFDAIPDDPKNPAISWFQQGFFAHVWLWVASLPLDLDPQFKAELAELAAFVGKWPATIFGDAADPRQFPWQHAGQYNSRVVRVNADGSYTLPKDGGELYDFGDFAGRPRPTVNHFIYHGQPDATASLISDGYPADQYPAIVLAAQLGIPGAGAGLKRVYASDSWAALDVEPQFAYAVKGASF